MLVCSRDICLELLLALLILVSPVIQTHPSLLEPQAHQLTP